MAESWGSLIEPCRTSYLLKVPFFLLFFLIFPLSSAFSVSFDGNATVEAASLQDPKDMALLLLFKLQFQENPLSSWDANVPMSNWTGVTRSNQTGRVTGLNLTRFNLSGQVHPCLCNLTFLETLVLSHNSFNTSIPSCLWRLWSLRTLDLSYNMFTGVLPSTAFATMSQIIELDLSHNMLRGEIPMWIGNFSVILEKLNLGFNSFHGELPKSLLNLMTLKYLNLSHNSLIGNVGDFSQALVSLNLESNMLSGTLPCLFSSRESLTVLNLANNSILGGIPTCISSLGGLTQLNLSHNELRYGISPRMVFSERLCVLDLSYNELSGKIPSRIAEASDKSGLLLLDLSHNQFSGCFQLLALILNNNNLSGEIQPVLDALDSLKIFDIGNNKISGEIPLTLAGCKSLEVVDLSYNNLSGSLNDAITKWPNLKFLSLARNKFSGSLPSWLFTFQAIHTLDFSGNKFSGYIPDGNFNSSPNFYNGDIRKTTLAVPSISDRSLVIKLSLVADETSLIFNYNLTTTIGIDLSENLLHGEIPVDLFGLHGLEYLNLSYNFLNGPVPGSIGKLQKLKALDLSHNSLSGHIPENITVLRNLTVLNLSYNCFSGVIPTKRGYWKFLGAFAGNPDLCMESSSNVCQRTFPVEPGKKFKEEMEEGPLSIWVFCISALVSFYVGVIVLFCSTRTRSFILQTKSLTG
ncbi:receptor-like protein CLAVATA2 [Capsicum annuum]